MSRIAPFELAFLPFADEWFGRIRGEARASSKDISEPGVFLALAAVQQLLAEIESPELVSEHPPAAGEYLTLLYLAFRFWDAGQHVYPITKQAIDSAQAAVEAVDPVVTVPHGACYLQLPERWLWAQIDAEAPHEPVDGVFVADSGQGRALTIGAVLGLRAGREGFSQISVTALPNDLAAAGQEARTPPFAPTMDGGDQAGFKSLASTAELLHLTQLALSHARG